MADYYYADGTYAGNKPPEGAKVVKFNRWKGHKPPKGPKGLDLDSLLPWLIAGGAGLAAHTAASSMMEGDEKENKKKSAWQKALAALIPVGVGAAAGYGGYSLGKMLKQSQDNSSIFKIPESELYQEGYTKGLRPSYTSDIIMGEKPNLRQARQNLEAEAGMAESARRTGEIAKNVGGALAVGGGALGAKRAIGRVIKGPRPAPRGKLGWVGPALEALSIIGGTATHMYGRGKLDEVPEHLEKARRWDMYSKSVEKAVNEKNQLEAKRRRMW